MRSASVSSDTSRRCAARSSRELSASVTSVAGSSSWSGGAGSSSTVDQARVLGASPNNSFKTLRATSTSSSACRASARALAASADCCANMRAVRLPASTKRWASSAADDAVLATARRSVATCCKPTRLVYAISTSAARLKRAWPVCSFTRSNSPAARRPRAGSSNKSVKLWANPNPS